MGKMNWNRVRSETQFAKWREDNPEEYRAYREAKQLGEPSDPTLADKELPPRRKRRPPSVKKDRILCPDCNQDIQAKRLQEHQKSHCPALRVKACPVCSTLVTAKFFQAHLEGHRLETGDLKKPTERQVSTKLREARATARCPVCGYRISPFDPGGYNECEACWTEFRLGPL